jgi:hypothetical protein
LFNLKIIILAKRKACQSELGIDNSKRYGVNPCYVWVSFRGVKQMVAPDIPAKTSAAHPIDLIA